MTKHEFVEYIKNHKKEIALGALATIGTGVLIAVGIKSIHSIKNANWADKNVVEGFTTGKVNKLWNEGDCGNTIVQFFKIKDMGDLGEDLKKIGGITDDTEVSAVLSFVDTKVEI